MSEVRSIRDVHVGGWNGGRIQNEGRTQWSIPQKNQFRRAVIDIAIFNG